MRLGPDGAIGGYIPLLGGALAIGNAWPSYYEPVALPDYYESYYGLGPYNSYRYADDVIYRVDPADRGDHLDRGAADRRRLRGRAADAGRLRRLQRAVRLPRRSTPTRPDATYRYSDGYVYQVDPETRLIAAAIELLAS